MKTIISERVIRGTRAFRIIFICDCGRNMTVRRNIHEVEEMLQLVLTCQGCKRTVTLYKDDFIADAVK